MLANRCGYSSSPMHLRSISTRTQPSPSYRALKQSQPRCRQPTSRNGRHRPPVEDKGNTSVLCSIDPGKLKTEEGQSSASAAGDGKKSASGNGIEEEEDDEDYCGAFRTHKHDGIIFIAIFSGMRPKESFGLQEGEHSSALET